MVQPAERDLEAPAVSPTAARSRTHHWSDPSALAAEAAQLDGLEFLRRVAGGTLPPPPIAELMGFTVTEVEAGRIVFALDPQEWMFNPIGSVHGGVAATILDSCMGCAVQSTLPAGTGYTTTDLHVRYLRGMSADTGRVLATGTVVHGGRRQATADARLEVEATGKLIATGTSGCIIL
jgi:uncharacterized protein (TIGR00369 family)